MSVALRLMNLAHYLASRRYGASYVQLEQEFEVCQRQLRRDLDALETMGFRVDAWDAEDGTRRFKLARLPEWMTSFLESGRDDSAGGGTESRGGVAPPEGEAPPRSPGEDAPSTSDGAGAVALDIPLCA